MRILGAILAGGRSIRFGSDKAAALIGSRSLIEHAIEALAPQVSALVVCGRSWRGRTALADRPEAGLGPLGGLNAALHHAVEHGFDAVLSVPVDVFPLPPDLLLRFAGKQAETLRRHHAIGLWSAGLAPALDRHLAAGHRSIRSWIEVTGASSTDDAGLDLRNINTPADLPMPR